MWVYTIIFLVINVCSITHFFVINAIKQVRLRDKPDMPYEEFKARLERRRTGIVVQKVVQSILTAAIAAFIIAVFAKAGYDYNRGYQHPGELQQQSKGISAMMAVLVGLTCSMAWAMGQFTSLYFRALDSLAFCFYNEKGFQTFLKNDEKIGVFVKSDPERKIAMRKDIYQLAYTLCMTQEQLEEFLEGKLQYIPLQTQINEVFIAAIICGASVIFCATATAYESLNSGCFLAKTAEAESQCNFSYVSWELQLTRLICACLFHFLFEEEIVSALKLMKFVTLNPGKFRYSLFAFFFALLQIVTVAFIEVIQIINLVQLDNMQDIVMNFVSLIILA